MSWRELHELLEDILWQINVSNSVSLPSDVWTTGGRKVCEFVLSHTTEEDLLLCNWTLELMHREHFNAIGQDPGDCQETFYRDGKQMDRDVLLAQAEELFGPLPKKEWET